MVRFKKSISDFMILLKSRGFPAALLSVMLALAVYGYAGPTGFAASADEEPQPAAAQEGIQPKIKPEAAANGYYPIYVVENGEKRKVMVKGGTVADVFAKIELTLSKFDDVDVPLESGVQPGDVITVKKTRFNTVEKRSKIPFETVMRYSPEVAPGKEQVLFDGEEGVQFQTIRQTIVDGVIEDEEVKDFVVEKEPVAREVLMGFPVKPVSSYDFGFEFDENCEPIGYLDVLRSQKSAGYSAPANASTASGLNAVVGHVAVNPKVIPYGTKLFIKSSDGKHIYGYAIAADTGTALMNGRITVDLLYSSYEESAKNGIRDVDIFILGE